VLPQTDAPELAGAAHDELVACALALVAAAEALRETAASRAGGASAPALGPVLETPARRHGDVSRVASLTGREREVFERMARGASNAEIASELFLGVPTVKTHVGRILVKLGLRDRAQAIVFAYESGLVRPAGARIST
jgi:DNA-binding NarL/FixJ family response regulator